VTGFHDWVEQTGSNWQHLNENLTMHRIGVELKGLV